MPFIATGLKFISSCYYLLKKQYGNGIEMKLRIEDRFAEYMLPPLTLQLRVENAVKHNHVMKEKPLTIEISTNANGLLSVKNNLQRKTGKVDSSKILLNNIKEKYQLMNQPEIVIEETWGELW